jgi:methionyl-tRNA synthetase
VESAQPWSLAKSARNGDAEAGVRLAGVLGDLMEACRVISVAAAPFMPETAARAAEQLGVAYAYDADGNSGPPLSGLVAWGALPAGGRIGVTAPLFPRLEVDETGGTAEPS